MAWTNYALGAIALAGLEVLVTTPAAQGVAGLTELPGLFLSKLIDPTVPFFGGASSSAGGTAETAQQAGPSSGTSTGSWFGSVAQAASPLGGGQTSGGGATGSFVQIAQAGGVS